MTISVPSQLVYSSQGDGVTTEFTYPVRFEEASELVVISREDGVDTVLTLNTDYTVAGAGLDAGGTVTMLYTPAATEEIVRYRDTAAKQIVNLADSTRNPAEAVENQLDRFAMNAQDQAERLSRALLARPGSTGQTLPEPEADKIIMWNTDGDGLINRTVGEQGELVPGVNTGDIISTNNGSDFADPAATLGNLGGTPTVADRTALKALSTTLFSVARLKEAGREGTFVLRSGTPPHTDTYEGFYVVSDTAGFYWERQLGAYYALAIEWFGATADDETFDNHDIVEKAFELSDQIGIKATAGRGTFWLHNTVGVTCDSAFEFHASQGTVFKAHSSFPVDNKMFLYAGTGTGRSFKWYGGKVDGSLLPARVSGAPDMLSINGTNLDEVYVEGVWFYNNDDRNGTAGDSGLFIAGHENIEVTRCLFQGAVDLGFYLSGDSTESFGRRCKVHGNWFIECHGGFIPKRSFQDMIVTGNFFIGCESSLVVGGEADTTLLPGKKAVISGNFFKGVNVAIEARISNGTTITGNYIEDWGIDKTGATTTNAAVTISGSKSCNVSGNTCIITGAYTPSAASAAIALERRTYNGTNYDALDNLVCGNNIRGAGDGIVEGASCDYNQFVANNMKDIISSRFVMSGANSIYQDIDPTNSRFTQWFGNSGVFTVPAGTNLLKENSGTLVESVLLPNNAAWIMLVGDPENNQTARVQYVHSRDAWEWRAGGSAGNVFELYSDGPRFGTHAAIAAETVTGYITIKDLSGVSRKVAVVS